MSEETKVIIQLAIILVLFYIMFYHATLIGIAAAAGFTILFGLQPLRFRNRRGSLTPAFCLTAFLWLCAGVPILLSFFRRH